MRYTASDHKLNALNSTDYKKTKTFSHYKSNSWYLPSLTVNRLSISIFSYFVCKMFDFSSADLEVQLVQLNHCDGVYNNYCNTLLRNLKLSPLDFFQKKEKRSLDCLMLSWILKCAFCCLKNIFTLHYIFKAKGYWNMVIKFF